MPVSFHSVCQFICMIINSINTLYMFFLKAKHLFHYRATGNIKVVNHETVKLVFHSQRRCAVDLRLDVANKYGNYSSSDYRGMLEFYGTPKIVLHDMEDPEEVLLKEAEAKVEAKKGKKEEKKDKKGKENKEQVQNMTTASSNWLCKLPVALPKVSSTA